MVKKGLNVTNQDLSELRKLFRYFFVEAMKELFDSKENKENKVIQLLKDVDDFGWLEEPLITAQIGLNNAPDAQVVTLVVSDVHYNAYKDFAFFDIRSNYIKCTSEDDKIVEKALKLQKLLLEVLDAAIDIEPEPKISFTQPPASKAYLN